MATTWIIAADESRARALQVTGQQDRLEQIDDLQNPAGRAQDRELQTDAEPRFNGHGGAGKAGSGRTGGPASDREAQRAVEHSVRTFAREVGRYLDKARQERLYDELVLVAPPKFLGGLRKELRKEVEKLVADELPKDLSCKRAGARALFRERKRASALIKEASPGCESMRTTPRAR